MSKVIRVGVMPGKIQEVAVEVGYSVAQALEIAGYDASGYDIKMDNTKVVVTEPITSATELILLVKQVKGNAEKLVRVGMMPGKINTYATETGASISEVIAQADLSAQGYDVKVDNAKINPDEATVTENTEIVLLVKQVKGNK